MDKHKIRLSYSALGAFDGCKAAFYKKYINFERGQFTNIHMVVGSQSHKIVQQLVESGLKYNDASLLKFLSAKRDKLDCTYYHTLEMLQSGFYDVPFYVFEKPFNFEFKHFIFVIKPDILICRDVSKLEFELYDYKTSQKHNPEYEFQLKLYKTFLENKVTVSKLGIIYLLSGDIKYIENEKINLDAFYQKIENILSFVSSPVVAYTDNFDICKSCEYLLSCERIKNPITVLQSGGNNEGIRFRGDQVR